MLERVVLACLSAIMVNPAASADDRLNTSGDIRFRMEQDWASARTDGSERPDRLRARLRARLQLNYRFSDTLDIAIRARSGNPESQQSPHVTVADFDGGQSDGLEAGLDRWRMRWRSETGAAFLGRDSLPLWRRNELFWDDDVTVAGLGGHISGTQASGRRWRLAGGRFQAPVGLNRSSGSLTAGQFMLEQPAGAHPWTAAAGVISIEADRDDPDAARLLSGNGGRDYLLLMASVETQIEIGGQRVTIGADLVENVEDYSAADPDPRTAANSGQTSGWVISARQGDAPARGDWRFDYYFARIETLAVNASYAQDDWVRWGANGQTRSSGFQGHELRAAYGLGGGANITARLYIVDGLRSEEDGNRARIDLNWRF